MIFNGDGADRRDESNHYSSVVPSRTEFKDLLQRGLIERPDVWRHTLLLPGKWFEPTKEETVEFLMRLADDHEAAGKFPLTGLFRPLAAIKLNLSFAPLILWHIVINAGFDTAVLDILETDNGSWQWPIEEDSLGLGRRRRFRKESGLIDTFHQEDDTASDACDKVKSSRRMVHSLYKGFQKAEDMRAKEDQFISPSKVAKMAIKGSVLNDENQLVEFITFCVSLSFRDGQRLRILYPDDFRSIDIKTNFKPTWANKVIIPEVCHSAGKCTVRTSVLVNAAIYDMEFLWEDEHLSISDINKKFDNVTNNISEMLVGPARVSYAL